MFVPHEHYFFPLVLYTVKNCSQLLREFCYCHFNQCVLQSDNPIIPDYPTESTAIGALGKSTRARSHFPPAPPNTIRTASFTSSAPLKAAPSGFSASGPPGPINVSNPSSRQARARFS